MCSQQDYLSLPRQYMSPLATTRPAPSLAVCMSPSMLHWSMFGSYRSMLVCRRLPSKPPATQIISTKKKITRNKIHIVNTFCEGNNLTLHSQILTVNTPPSVVAPARPRRTFMVATVYQTPSSSAVQSRHSTELSLDRPSQPPITYTRSCSDTVAT